MSKYIRIRQPREFETIDRNALFDTYFKNPSVVNDYVNSISQTKYMFWNKAQFHEPVKGLTEAESWYLAREIRKISSSNTPVRATSGQFFTWMRLEYTDELLRKIDMYAGGNFLSESLRSNGKGERQKYLIRGIMEEAIASSQLEGADTSRRYAKKMLVENITPRNSSDWMILNNYKVLSKIEEDYRNQDLSLEMLREIQHDLTANTDEEGQTGRFRLDSDDIVVRYDDKIAFSPPKTNFVRKELERLIEYANDNSKFIHPVLKAIILHFWIGYLHPFPDGNGRTARAIFYWYLLKNEYWAFAYLPTSTIVKKAPSQYAYAYIYAEQDNLDFTYFYDYIIHRIIMAIDEFQTFIERKVNDNRAIADKLKVRFPNISINVRQEQLLYFLLDHLDDYATISSHIKLNGISRQTASRDIHELEQIGLLISRRDGRFVNYSLAESAMDWLNM